MTVVSLDMAYRSFREVLAGSHPPRYAAYLKPSSPRFTHNSPGHEGSPKRDPEAEDLGDGRDVGVREALVLEQRHRHRARDVARHTEARDEQQDRDRHRAEPLEEVVDRRPDRLDEAGMRL